MARRDAALAQLRGHAEAGILLGQLDQWLHQRPAGNGQADVAAILRPYRDAAPSSRPSAIRQGASHKAPSRSAAMTFGHPWWLLLLALPVVYALWETTAAAAGRGAAVRSTAASRRAAGWRGCCARRPAAGDPAGRGAAVWSAARCGWPSPNSSGCSPTSSSCWTSRAAWRRSSAPGRGTTGRWPPWPSSPAAARATPSG